MSTHTSTEDQLLQCRSHSHSDVGRVARYIADQQEHHRKRTYLEEYAMFVKRYGLEWRAEGNH